ncbi:MAG: FtsX-like permease family protein [Gemmataceae bacterium]
MTRRLPVPLAWLNLTHSRLRVVLFCAGIGFAVLLMFLQFGCRKALLDANVLLLERLRDPLVVVSRRQTTILLRSTFPRDLLQRALGVEGVASVQPVYLEYATSFLRNAEPDPAKRDPSQVIRVVGLDPDAYVLDFPQLNPAGPDSLTQALHLSGRALFDSKAKHKAGAPSGTSVYGPVRPGTQTDLAGQRIVVVGLVELGIDFGTDGTLIVGLDTFRQVLRSSPYGPTMNDVDLGMVRLAPGADPARVQRSLAELYGDDGEVEVLTREQLMGREQRFWLNNTPIGAVFNFGMFMGFLVGLVICYQILSTDIRDNLSAYATLRAIGYPNAFLARVVFEESMLLAVMGFVPGTLVSWGLYLLLEQWTDLPLRMTPARASFIFALTVVMCVASGLLAVRQATQADPAEVF